MRGGHCHGRNNARDWHKSWVIYNRKRGPEMPLQPWEFESEEEQHRSEPQPGDRINVDYEDYANLVNEWDTLKDRVAELKAVLRRAHEFVPKGTDVDRECLHYLTER